MYLFNPETKEFTRVLNKTGDPSSPENQWFTAIVEDTKGNFWIRTYDGLYQYNAALKLHNS